jgi:prepilin-type N-terminal cleavage/methylation domain-containing protein
VNPRGRLSDESGFTLVEMLVVLAILGIVLTALTGLFLSGTRTAADQNARFQAQQEGRLALDSLRREIHCAGGVTSTQVAAPPWPSSSVKVSLGSYCSTGGGSAVDVTWCTSGSAGRYVLRRVQPALAAGAPCAGGIQKADYLTLDKIFNYVPASGQRAKLSVDLPVDVSATTPGGLYELQDDIVLRNTPRTP